MERITRARASVGRMIASPPQLIQNTNQAQPVFTVINAGAQKHGQLSLPEIKWGVEGHVFLHHKCSRLLFDKPWKTDVKTSSRRL